MNYKTCVVAAVVFALVGTLAIASIAPSLFSEANAKGEGRNKNCPENSPNRGESGPPCGGNSDVRPGPPPKPVPIPK